MFEWSEIAKTKQGSEELATVMELRLQQSVMNALTPIVAREK